MTLFERLSRVLEVQSGYAMTKYYGISAGALDALKKNKLGKVSNFFARLSIEALEALPEDERLEILKKIKKKT